MRVAGDPALQLSWLLMLALRRVVAVSRKLVVDRINLHSSSMLPGIDTTLLRHDTRYRGGQWVCQGPTPLRRRSTTGAPPNLACLRRRCNCADIGAALNPLPHTCSVLALRVVVEYTPRGASTSLSSVMCRPCAQPKRQSTSKRPVARQTCEPA